MSVLQCYIIRNLTAYQKTDNDFFIILLYLIKMALKQTIFSGISFGTI